MQILDERKRTHGSFADVAKIHEELMLTMHNSPNWVAMTDEHKLALTMISSKLARVLAGDFTFEDHYVDICGYATLAQRASSARSSNKESK